MSGRECTMPRCDEPVADGRARGGLCESHAPDIETPDEDDDVTESQIAEHYEQIATAIEELGELDDGSQTLGNHDFVGWYRSRNETRPNTIRAGYDQRGSVYRLKTDFRELREDLDRVLYATTNYQQGDALNWQPFTSGDDGKEWLDDEKPTPNYGDITALPVFADIDLSAAEKERPLSEDKQATVERALGMYVEAYAELAGSRESVYALDSVGGAYLFTAPQATAPIAEYFDHGDRKRIFKEFTSRANEWLDDVRERVNEEIPEAKGVFEPDLLNNANRLYKAPLSLHSSIDGVVHPIDTESPEYDFVPFDEAAGEVEPARAWAEGFTADSHESQVGSIVAGLWPDYYDEDEGWQAALEEWLEGEKESEREREIEQAAIERRRDDRERDLDDIETTEHIQDVYDAIDRIDVREVVRSLCYEYDTDPGRDPVRFNPGYHDSGSGTSCFVDREGYTDLEENKGGGGAVTYVAREYGIITSSTQTPRGKDFWEAVDQLRDMGYSIPRLDSGEKGGSSDPVSALPLAQLDALSPQERRRAAKKRGVEWPSTDEARERLFQKVTEVMREKDSRVVDAPTSLGKSHTIAATPWEAPQYEDVTGDRPVVHLSKTKNARAESVKTAREDGGGCFVLLGRHEACPVAGGEYDLDSCEGGERAPITVDGVSASDWITQQCEGKGIPFSVVHTKLKNRMDQDRELPCCADGERCRAIVQWEDLREGDHQLIEATHNFARVPGLRMHTNMVFDEEPDFAEDLSTDRVRPMISAFLKEIDAPVTTWETFIGLCRTDAGGDAGAEADQLGKMLEDPSIDTDWYFDEPDAHTLAPAIARAIFYAEDRGNGRWGSTTSHDPPRLDANAADDDGWNREWIRVVLDEDNEVRTVRCSPDLNLCRSVIGLDAHPSMPKWQVNTDPSIQKREVLDPTERQLWRRYERGLRVVQVGDATRPYASGEYFNGTGTQAVIEHLRDEYGAGFRTCITASSVEEQTQELMREAGVSDPETMHYGEEKSRNDFATEDIGFVNGSIDPGDDYVINLLAELDLDAEPETDENDDGEEYRVHGRGFIGDDAETAAEILASVRENHVAQSAGRYARDPDDPESTATVFVRTDAMPVAFADVQVPGVEWTFSDQQRKVIEAVRERERPATAKEISNETGVSKGHTQRTLKRLAENSAVDRFEGEGAHGADLYVDTGLPNSGVVSTDSETVTDPSRGPHTWSVSISPPTASTHLTDPPDHPEQVNDNVWWLDDSPNRPAESGGGGDA